jgi:hypothetical protein
VTGQLPLGPWVTTTTFACARHRAKLSFSPRCLLMAHRVNSRQRSTLVPFGAKRTLSEPRFQKADLRVHSFKVASGSRLLSMARRRCNSARAATSSLRNLVQPALCGHQFRAALADGFHQMQARLRPHRLGVRTHKIAINSYPIQRPLWTTLRTQVGHLATSEKCHNQL